MGSNYRYYQNKIKERGKNVQALRYILNNSFWAYCLYMDRNFFLKRPFLQDVANALQEVEVGNIQKLMISMPPRAGKSYIVSLWCTWVLGKHPDGSIMRNSYGQSLAEKFSYDVRDIIQFDHYKSVFSNVELKSDKQGVADWRLDTAKQSSYFCSGVGGAITGKGCKTAAILDDPIKNLEDALSLTILDKTWNWYTSTHKSRIETGCPEIIISTRWSQKDPTGRLLDLEPNDWKVLVIPALDEHGKSFCEDVKTTEEYHKMKAVMDSFIWEAEFMQNPVEAKGLLFPKSSLLQFSMDEVRRFYSHGQEKWDAVIGYTDVADKGKDFLASVTGCIKGQYLYLTDVVFTQDPIEVTEPCVAQMIIDTKQDKHIIESNNGGSSFAKNIRELVKGKSRTTIRDIAQTKNKETRILMKSGQIKQFVYFRNDYEVGSDYDKFMRQLTNYVKMGVNQPDDAPDSLTGLLEHAFLSTKIEFA